MTDIQTPHWRESIVRPAETIRTCSYWSLKARIDDTWNQLHYDRPNPWKLTVKDSATNRTIFVAHAASREKLERVFALIADELRKEE